MNGGRIYIIGGCIGSQLCGYGPFGYNCACNQTTSSTMYYLPEKDTWHVVAAAPRNRFRHSAALLNNNIYVVGGRTVEDNIIYEVDMYNPLSDQWNILPLVMWPNLNSDGVMFARGTKLYYIGGYDQSYSTSFSTIVSYDVITQQFDHTLPNMAYGRGDTSIATFNNDEFIVMGGFQTDNFFCEALDYVEKYSVSAKTWTTMNPMLYKQGKPAVGVMGNYLFTIAGETKDNRTKNVPVPYVSRMRAVSEAWAVEANISTKLFRFVGVVYNHSSDPLSRGIYLFGGQTSFDAATSSHPLV